MVLMCLRAHEEGAAAGIFDSLHNPRISICVPATCSVSLTREKDLEQVRQVLAVKDGQLREQLAALEQHAAVAMAHEEQLAAAREREQTLLKE